MLTGVEIRGDEWDVDWQCVEDDPTTNAFCIEWWFYNDEAPQNITEAEEDSILDQLTVIYLEGDGGPHEWDFIE